MPSLIIVRGAPGSGKSTIAQALSKRLNCHYFEADMYFVQEGVYKFDPSRLKAAHSWCQSTVTHHIKLGYDVIVSNTFTKVWEMQSYIEVAKEYGYDIQIIHAQGNFSNVHGVPQEVVDRMKNNFEPYVLTNSNSKV